MRKLLSAVFVLLALAHISASAQVVSKRLPSIDAREKAAQIASLFNVPAEVAETISQEFKRFYPAEKCWLREVDNDEYCFKLASYQEKGDPGNQRNYLLLAGSMIGFNSPGEIGGCQACSGLVASYIFDANGSIRLLKKSDLLEVGVSGYAPIEWRLLQVAGNAYWETPIHTSEAEGMSICHQGGCSASWYLLGENHRGEIVVLVDARSKSDDVGAVGEKKGVIQRWYFFMDGSIENGMPVVKAHHSVDRYRKKTVMSKIKLPYSEKKGRYLFGSKEH